MKRKMAIFLSLAIMLTFFIPTGASAHTNTNGVAWNIEANNIIKYARTLLGTPYQYGARYGNTTRFDCSSFVKYVYRNYITMPRTASAQAKMGRSVSMNNLRSGDLVFFKSAGGSSKVTHVAIYAGNGKLLHTYGAGGVKYSSFSSYWKKRYATARRVLK